MTFHEKSAWVMTLGLLLGGVVYFGIVASMSSQLGQLAPPNIPVIVVYTVVLVFVAIVGHTLAAIMAPKEANAALDERERAITERAGHLSGYIFAIGVLLSLGLYLLSYEGNLLFYTVFGSLMLAQTVEYLLQIILHRVGS